MTNNNPSIDVIIPVHNGMPWLENTLESVLDQTYQNLHIYIIDDGSTDSTRTLVKSVRDKRIIYIHKKNGGVSSARNLGIHKSNSPFVAFLDADDVWRKDKLEKQLAVIQSDDEIGMVYGYHNVIDDKDSVQSELRISKRGHLFDELVKGNCIAGSASMVLVRRSILDQAGYFNENLINGEDWEMWLRISKLCLIDFVPEVIASIRIHNTNTQSNTAKMAKGLIDTYFVIKNEYELTRSQQRLLASYCLYYATTSYYQIGDFKASRHVLRLLLKENPPALYDANNWRITIVPSLFLKIAFSHIFFRRTQYIVDEILCFPRKLTIKMIYLIKKVIRKIRRIIS